MDQRIQVLIADDATQSRSGLKALMASLPAIDTVREATDGQEAIRLRENAPPGRGPHGYPHTWIGWAAGHPADQA
jgi:hypothetical protein